MALDRTSKEIVRHFILKLGLTRAHMLLRRVRGQNVDHLSRASLADRFSAIYDNKVWLNNRSLGVLSGLGSELRNTTSVRGGLPELLVSLKCGTLLDIGCGDFSWMKEVSLPCACAYVGADIVPNVIQQNTQRYASSSRTFVTLDATSETLPGADVVLCREVLFHLSFCDIARVIKNVCSSSAKFLIATTDTHLKFNSDILSGDFRLLNLERAPFFFPRPLVSLPDDALASDRILGVWSVSDLARGAARSRR